MKSNVRVWLQALRAYAYPASVIPIIITASLVIYNGQKLNYMDLKLLFHQC